MLAKWTMSLKGVKRLFAVLVVITILSDIPGVQSVRIGAPQQKLRQKGKSSLGKPNFYILFYTHSHILPYNIHLYVYMVYIN